MGRLGNPLKETATLNPETESCHRRQEVMEWLGHQNQKTTVDHQGTTRTETTQATAQREVQEVLSKLVLSIVLKDRTLHSHQTPRKRRLQRRENQAALHHCRTEW